MPSRLSKIDELTRPDHTFLTPNDECYYLGEYTARRGYTFSEMNDLVQNLKKPMDRKGRPEWRYKEWAVRRSAQMFREALNEEWLKEATLIPVPPSKTRTHPEYDDRLLRILQQTTAGLTVDIRELVVMNSDVEAAHLTDARRSVQDLIDSMEIDEDLAAQEIRTIGVFDDVLTTGAHFKAVQAILTARLPNVAIVGIFVARRAPEAAEI